MHLYCESIAVLAAGEAQADTRVNTSGRNFQVQLENYALKRTWTHKKNASRGIILGRKPEDDLGGKTDGL